VKTDRLETFFASEAVLNRPLAVKCSTFSGMTS
jgi:hypothetical protein